MVSVTRTMPSTPCMVGEGICGELTPLVLLPERCRTLPHGGQRVCVCACGGPCPAVTIVARIMAYTHFWTGLIELHWVSFVQKIGDGQGDNRSESAAVLDYFLTLLRQCVCVVMTCTTASLAVLSLSHSDPSLLPLSSLSPAYTVPSNKPEIAEYSL